MYTRSKSLEASGWVEEDDDDVAGGVWTCTATVQQPLTTVPPDWVSLEAEVA